MVARFVVVHPLSPRQRHIAPRPTTGLVLVLNEVRGDQPEILKAFSIR